MPASVKPTDAELEAFYKSNAALFQAPEQANIEYVVLDLDTVKKGLTVNEQDLKTYYEQNAARMGGKEERRASHILIAAPKGAPAAEREKAKAKAEELLAAVKKAPDSFADVAKKNSQDPGSAANGGDLDFFARGAMTKAFEDAAFALKKGEISGVVETEFGYHIIKLTDIKAPKQRSFEEMKPELEAEVKKQQAQRKFAESADAFSNGVYEQADSLKPVADKPQAGDQDREQRAPHARAGRCRRAGQPQVPRRAVLARQHREEAQHRSRGDRAQHAGRRAASSQYTPARTLPLAEVKERVRERAGRGARRRTRQERGHGEAGRLEGQSRERQPAGGGLGVAAGDAEAAARQWSRRRCGPTRQRCRRWWASTWASRAMPW